MVALLIIAVLVVIAVVVAVTQSDRYRPRVRTEFTMPTSEVHVDPVTGMRQRVYVNPASGERAFVDEPVPLHGEAPPLVRPGLIPGPPPPQGWEGPAQLPPGGGAPR